MSLTYNESYDRPAEPQLVRNDFAELAELSNPAELLASLANTLPADVLAEFIDDRLMGRV
jgi:hypothetical protein